MRPALISPGSNANTAPPPRTASNGAGRPCGASRSPMEARQAAAHSPRSRGAAVRAASRRSQARRSPRPQRAGRRQARHRTKAPDRHHQDGCLIRPRAICLRCCDLTTPVPIKKGEPCCMSCSPLPATSASAIASCTSPWLRSARRIARAPPRLSARCSTKRRHSSPALVCDSLRTASATAYRACLPWLAGRAQHRHGRRAGPLIGAKTGHFALRYVRRSEIKQFHPVGDPSPLDPLVEPAALTTVRNRTSDTICFLLAMRFHELRKSHGKIPRYLPCTCFGN